MLCWGLLYDMEKGIDTKNRKCGRECELHIEHNPKLLEKILRNAGEG